MTAAPGRVGPRFRHEGGEVAVLFRDLLHAVLERERVVRTGETASGREVDLPLRSGVLAIRRDDVDADLRHLVEDPADRGHEVVPERVEDVVAGEQRLVGVTGQEIELELGSEERLEPHRTGLLERLPEDVPGCRGEGRPVVPLGVADQPRRSVGPRQHLGGVGIGEQQLVSVAALLVIERPADDIRAGIQHARPAVHVQTSFGVVEGVCDRDRLRSRDAVHVGKLESDEPDVLLLPALQDPLHVGHRSAPLDAGAQTCVLILPGPRGARRAGLYRASLMARNG